LQPTKKELKESIEALQKYKDRLRSEIITMSQKLRISKLKIESTLNESLELKNIEIAIEKLNTSIKQLN